MSIFFISIVFTTLFNKLSYATNEYFPFAFAVNDPVGSVTIFPSGNNICFNPLSLSVALQFIKTLSFTHLVTFCDNSNVGGSLSIFCTCIFALCS